MKLRQLIIIASSIGLIVGSLVLMNIFSSQKEEPKKNEKRAKKKFVKTQAVKYNKVQTSVVAYGRVNSTLPLDVIAEVRGKTKQGKMPLKEGQAFGKGSLLFKIDDTEAKLTLQSTKSNFMRDVAATLPDFKIDFPESFETWQNYFNSIKVDEVLPELPSPKNAKEKTYLATKNIFSAYYNIKSSEANLSKYHVYAPFSGSISEVLLQTGSFVNTGSKVAKIIKSRHLELKLPIEIADIKWVNKGSEVYISSEDNSQQWKGFVSRIGDVVDPNTQAINVFVQISPNKNKLYEGMYLKATIPGKSIENAMEIPRSAIINGSQVYAVEQDSLLKVKEVVVHKINDETVVFSGMKEGGDIVIEPLINAFNDMKVKKLGLNKKEEKDTSTSVASFTSN